jgi:2'-5' RNA ligase
MNPERFICVSLVPDALAERLEPLRAELAAIGGAREALAYPPHVTLRTGFIVPADDEAAFFEEFDSVVDCRKPFAMRAHGLRRESYGDGIAQRFLIAFNVDLDTGLRELHEALLRYSRFMKGAQYEYRPHLTLAFHDLGAEGFALCSKWIGEHPSLSSESFEWTCDNVCLCSQANGQWIERRRYRLG